MHRSHDRTIAEREKSKERHRVIDKDKEIERERVCVCERDHLMLHETLEGIIKSRQEQCVAKKMMHPKNASQNF